MKMCYQDCQFHLFTACFTTRSVKLTNITAENAKLFSLPSYFASASTVVSARTVCHPSNVLIL